MPDAPQTPKKEQQSNPEAIAEQAATPQVPKKEQEDKPKAAAEQVTSTANFSRQPADHDTPRATVVNTLPPGYKGLAASRHNPKNMKQVNRAKTVTEQVTSTANFSRQPADHNTPRAIMVNTLPPGYKGLAASRHNPKNMNQEDKAKTLTEQAGGSE